MMIGTARTKLAPASGVVSSSRSGPRRRPSIAPRRRRAFPRSCCRAGSSRSCTGRGVSSTSSGSSSVQAALPESIFAPTKSGPACLDQIAQFPRVQVAGVILDRDLHAGIERLLSARFQHLHRVGDPRADAALGLAIFAGAEDDAEDRRAERLRHAEPESQMLLRGAPVLFEAHRGRADAPATRVELDPRSSAFFFTSRSGASSRLS